jgi:hypothetical protein
MGLSVVFVDFLQRIALGAGTVLLLFLFIRLGLPRRSAPVNRQTTDKLPQQ